MSARVVGWVEKRGRVDVTVGALLRIGAAEGNELVLPLPGISRAHARIIRLDREYAIEDAGSRNGTRLNGQPITRARLQHEVRRLHHEVAKTIVFVTHDIDEAITMGDRIAILREGGVLAQYDTPDAILAAPADDFVAQFIGEDRALRRLALHRLGDVALLPLRDGRGITPEAVTAAVSTTVRNALSLMIEAGRDELVVVGDDGAPLGVLTLAAATDLLRT